jgi:hypothetical protein
VVVELLIAGDQLPEMLLFDIKGKEIEPPSQTGGICVNRGVEIGFVFVRVIEMSSTHSIPEVTLTL